MDPKIITDDQDWKKFMDKVTFMTGTILSTISFFRSFLKGLSDIFKSAKEGLLGR